MSKKNQGTGMEAEIRRRIEKRFEKRAEFFSHLIAFLAVNGVGWMLLLRMGPGSLAMSVCTGMSLLWAMGLAIHAVQYLFEEGKERTIQREIERERAVRYMNPYGEEAAVYREKAKNRSQNRAMRLTDDGELTDLIEDEDEPLEFDESDNIDRQNRSTRA